MATNTRQSRREAERKYKEYVQTYIDRWCVLFHNSVKIENKGDVPKRYLLKILLTQGGIAYDLQTGLYLPYTWDGIDVYGLPKAYTLIGFNGYTIRRQAEEVVILRANDLKMPLLNYLEIQARKVVDYDLAIEQNLDAIRTQTIAEVYDDATLLSLANEYESRRLGATVVYKNKSSNLGEIKVSSTGAQFLVDKLLEARKEVLNETLSTIGISVSNTDKKERVQGIEVLASQGYARDCIETLIDTFNHDAEEGGLSIRLIGNTTLEESTDIEGSEEYDTL